MITAIKGSLDRGTAAAGQNLGECLMRRSEEAAVHGDAALALARAKDAREEFRDAYAIRAGIYTDGHHMVAVSLGGLARSELAAGDLPAAEAAATRGLAMIRRTRRPEHPDVSDLLEVMGLVSLAQGKGAQAEQHLREALKLAELAHPPAPLRVALLRGELGLAVHDAEERARLLTESEREIAKLCGEASYLTKRARQYLARGVTASGGGDAGR
jgi:tetratricopeptide (TPR) repeat protein